VTEYLIAKDPTGRYGPTLRGAALELFRHKGPEIILSGPAETGKTFACLHKLHLLLSHHRGCQAVLCRKVRDTIHSTVLQTYLSKVLRKNKGVRAYGGERPVWFDYPHGARLWLAGLDDPGKALSSERDFIYVNQAEEISDDDWQVLTTRTTGRAGHAPYGQVLGDCNPGPPHHWIKARERSGRLRVLESRHEDNPKLWDAGKGDWTEQGRKTMETLDALTGVRKERLRYGRWVQAEGMVYEGWDARLHLIDRFPIPASWPRYWSVDFGFTNPFVLQWWAQDPDGRLYLYREIYHTGRLVEDHARRVLEIVGATAGDWSRAKEPRPRAVICDHDAEDRATLERHLKMPTTPAIKDVSPGLQAVASRLKVQEDGKARLFVLRDALDERDPALVEAKKPTCTAEEVEGYTWDTRAGRRKGEMPIDQNNHGMDGMRYQVYYLDHKPRAEFKARKPRVGSLNVGELLRREGY
jgi:PBSX family phage terminase large subunit